VFLVQENERLEALETKFAGHVTHTDRTSITAWLKRFDKEDWNLGLKLLESLDYYPQSRILKGSVELHKQALQLVKTPEETYVAAFGVTGKSGYEILYKYRLANDLSMRQLITLADLQKFIENPNASFILVDDLVASGDQATTTWKNIVSLLNPEQRVILAVHLAFKEGIDHIQSETRLQVVYNTLLSESDKVFSPSNTRFSDSEKSKLLGYCERADDYPKGYRGMQANIVFYYRAPDNCISILRSNHPSWRGLFPRDLRTL
jgi:hypothetical protein